MTDVFISYSRKDISFVRLLHKALSDNGLETWIDWQDIPPSVDWLAEVYEAIEKADTFLFIISDTSLKSEVCNLEITHAAKHNKRLIPVVINDVDAGLVPKELAALNWIFFDETGEEFSGVVEGLLDAISIDQDWVKAHTRFENRALAWKRKDKDKGLLLRGSDLSDAEDWLAGSADKDPKPTALQTQFIIKSREDGTQRQRRLLFSIGAVLIVLTGLTILSVTNGQQAKRNELLALDNAGTAQAASELALQEKEEAQNQALRSLTYSLSVSSSIQKDINPPRAILLAIEGYNKKDLPVVRRSLLDLFYKYNQIESIYSDIERFARDVTYSSDGKLIISYDYDNNIYVWDVNSGTRNLNLSYSKVGLESEIYDVILDPIGQVIAIRFADYEVKFWDLNNGEPIGNSITADISSLSMSKDGELLAVGNRHGVINIWEIEHWRLREPLVGHEKNVDAVNFSGTGKELVAISADDRIMIWDVETTSLIETTINKAERWGGITSISLNRENDMLAIAYRWGKIDLWDVTYGNYLGEIIHTASDIWEIDISPDGQYLAIGKKDGGVYIWDIAGKYLVNDSMVLELGGVFGLDFSPDGKSIAAGYDDGLVIVWDLSRNSDLGIPIPGEADMPIGITVSPDGKILAAGNDDEIQLWNVENGQPLGEPLAGHSDFIQELAFSPDGKILVSASNDSIILFWDLASRQIIGEPLTGHDQGVYSVAFSPDGRTLASSSGGSDYRIFFWDVETRTQISDPIEHNYGTTMSLDFSPDGKILAFSGGIEIALIESETRQLIMDLLTGHLGFVNCISFSPDGKLLASGGDDGYVILWDVISGNQVFDPMIGHRDNVYSVSFSPDGKTLASGSADGKIILWDVESGQIIGEPILGNRFGIYDLAFGEKGNILFSSGNGEINFLDISPEFWAYTLCQKINRGFTDSELRTHYLEENDRYPCSVWDDIQVLDIGLSSNYLRGGWFYFLQGDYRRAISYFDEVLRIDPTNAEAHKKLGDTYYALEEYEQAYANYEKYLDITTDKFSAFVEIGLIYKSQGNILRSIELFNMALEEEQEDYLDEQDNSAEAYNDIGWAYYYAGLYPEAIDNFSKQIDLSPEDGEGYNDRGYVYYEIGDYEETIADLEQAIELNPEEYGHGSNYDQLWYSHYYLGDYEKALEVLNKSIGSDMRYVGDLADRGRTHLQLGTEEKGREDMQAYLVEKNYSAHSYNYVGLSYFYIDYYSDAIENLTKQIQQSPDDGDGYNDRGSVYYEIEEYEKAIQDIEKAIELDPEEFRYDWNLDSLAYSYFYLGNHQKSEQYLQQILELSDYGAWGYNWLGWSYLDFEKYEQAILSFNKAIELNQDYATPYNGLGDVYYAIEKYDDALDNYLIYVDVEENRDQYILDRIEELSN